MITHQNITNLACKKVECYFSVRSVLEGQIN